MSGVASSDSTDEDRGLEEKINSGSGSEYEESQASGTDPASGDGDSWSSTSATERSQHDKSTLRVVEVQVGPVRRRSDYTVFPGDYWVEGITRVLGEVHGQPCYEAKLQNGLRVTIPHSRLLTRYNGSRALSIFQEHPASDSSDIGSASQRRQARARRTPGAGFVDSSTLTFSSDEDQQGAGRRTPAGSRGVKLRSGTRSDEGVNRRQSSRVTRSTATGHLAKLSFRRRTTDPDEVDGEYSGRSSVESIPYDDSDMSPLSKSKRLKMTKHRRGRSAKHAKIRKEASDADAEDDGSSTSGLVSKTTRRSARIKGTAKSKKGQRSVEAWVDDGNATTSTPKAFGARERFKELPGGNDFLLVHCQTCDTCGVFGRSPEKGPLVLCQGCTASYHQSCLGNRHAREHLVTKIGDEDFVMQCRRCINVARKKDPMAPRLDVCQGCREASPACAPFHQRMTAKQEEKKREENDGADPTFEVDHELINNVEKILFRCVSCKRGYHFEHLPSRAPDVEMTDSDTSIVELRYTQHCKDWTCLECFNAPGEIQGLVAWRPKNLDSYTPGYTVEMVEDDEKEYLIKWEGHSYFQATWMPGAWVWGVSAAAMRKAFARRDDGHNLPKMSFEDAVPEEYLTVDIVLDVEYTGKVKTHTEEIDKARIKEIETALVKYKGLGYEEIAWEKPPKPEDGERWTDFVSAYEEWVTGRYIQLPKQHALKDRLAKVRSMNFEKKILKKEQPESLVGGKMMEYQLDGLNWLLYKWHQSQNAILADEMGLGKTIQVIGLLSTLVRDHGCFPFLVVVPNSTCLNWRREVKRWAPELRAVAYYGSSEARDIAKEYEMFPRDGKSLSCHVVITSYEAPVDDSSRRTLKNIPWAGLVVDEGQRLKNDKNLLYQALQTMKTPFKVLMTGTPLQNNTRELLNLIQFLDPSHDADQLEQEFSELNSETVPRLHDLIRPFFLRRTKAQVLTFLPPMAQIIVPVTMSVLQKKLYKSILAKNPELIKSIFGKADKQLKHSERSNLNNILMQLRKCLCHPFVYSKLIEERNNNAVVTHRSLVEASSKLQLLEIMLPALKARGHRVLIFSQFLEMLDIVEDFLDNLELSFERLDGSVGSLQKQKRIDAFNAPNSSLFAFLLSTRAGGVGINLATADTVIIMDPDFNPHQDIQALSRAHRIGQQKKVLVFQLMTRGSAEEKMIQIGRKKMALDHVLIEKMHVDDEAGLDLQSILKHGASALFEDNTEHDIHYDEASVEKLLDRSQLESTKAGEDNSAESQFSFARVWANDQADLQDGLKDSEAEQTPSDVNIWDKLLREREYEAEKRRAAAQEMLGRGKRKRQAVNYNRVYAEGVDPGSPTRATAGTGHDTGSDTDFEDNPVEGDDGEEGDDDEFDEEPYLEGLLPDQLKAGNGKAGVHSLAAQVQPSLSAAAAEPAATPIASTAELPRATVAEETLPQQPNQPQLSDRSQQFRQSRPSSQSQLSGGVLPRHPWTSEFTSATLGPGQTVPVLTQCGLDNDDDQRPICLACHDKHEPGLCPLLQAGYELCPLCNLAHYGDGNTCPNLQSEAQVRGMIEGIKLSPEDAQVKAAALSYLRGVKGNLIRQQKMRDAKRAKEAAAATLDGKGNVAEVGPVKERVIYIIDDDDDETMEDEGVEGDEAMDDEGNQDAVDEYDEDVDAKRNGDAGDEGDEDAEGDDDEAVDDEGNEDADGDGDEAVDDQGTEVVEDKDNESVGSESGNEDEEGGEGVRPDYGGN